MRKVFRSSELSKADLALKVRVDQSRVVFLSMSYQVAGIAVLACIFFLYRLLNRTDTPKIKGLPEIPGLPLFGSLIELGEYHAVVAKNWAQKYGPVFQVRLGNKACWILCILNKFALGY